MYHFVHLCLRLGLDATPRLRPAPAPATTSSLF